MSCKRFFPMFVAVLLLASIATAQESPRSAADARSPETGAGRDSVPLRDWPVPVSDREVLLPVRDHQPQDGIINGVPAAVHNRTITPNSAPSIASNFVAVVPCRVLDTRNAAGPFGSPSYSAGLTRSFVIPASPCTGIPVAQAYSLNFTIVNYDVSSGGFVTAFQSGTAKPFVSTVNFGNGTNAVANAGIVPADSAGSIDVYSSGATHLIIDINGYFTGAGAGKLILYSGIPSAVGTGTPTLFATLGSFTKDSASTAVTATWQSHIRNAGPTGFCQFELRIDSLAPTGHTPGFGGAILYASSTTTDQQASFMGRWTGLSAGTHTVSLYLRGSGVTCTDNFGNFQRYVYIEEE